MNDHDAIDAIKEVLSECYRLIEPADALNKIAYIIGRNSISHHEESE